MRHPLLGLLNQGVELGIVDVVAKDPGFPGERRIARAGAGHGLGKI